MKTIKELRNELNESIGESPELDEALTRAQRIKRSQIAKRNKAKIQRALKKGKKKRASTETLQKRAKKKARDLLYTKLLKGRDRADVSFSEQERIEKKLDKMRGAINRIAKKLLPQLKKAEQSKMSGKNEETELDNEVQSEASAKYEITDETHPKSKKFRRIRALKSFSWVSGRIKAGDLGGYVESEKNLSQKGSCWIAKSGIVAGNAVVKDSAVVTDTAQVMGDAKISGKSRIYGNATVSGKTVVEDSHVSQNAKVMNNASVVGDSNIEGSAEVYGSAKISEKSTISGKAVVYGKAQVSGNSLVTDNAEVYGSARVNKQSQISGNTELSGTAEASAVKLSSGKFSKNTDKR